MGSLIEFITTSPQETFEIGQRLASLIIRSRFKDQKYGNIIALNGELGSGKTCLAKGIADGLGIKECITSPTYTIINEYNLHQIKSNETEYTFFHIDTYRLNNEKEFEDIGGPEILSSNGVFVIEWSEKIKNLLPGNTIDVYIEITGHESRKIIIKGIDKL